MSRYTCAHVRRWIVAPSQADLTADERQSLKKHLAMCGDCREEQALLGQLQQALQTDPLPPMDPMTQRRLLSGHPPARESHGRAKAPVLRWAGALAVVALVVTFAHAWIAGLWGVQREHPEALVAVAEGDRTDAVTVPSGDGPLTARVDPAGGNPFGPEPAQPSGAAAGPGGGSSSRIADTPYTATPPGAPPSIVPTDMETIPLEEADRRMLRQLAIELDATPSIEVLTRLAHAHRRARQYDDAARIYLALIDGYPRSTAAGSSRVALGQMKLDAMGLPQEALGEFDAYLATYPQGSLAEEARVGRVRAHKSLEDPGQVLIATDEYVRFHTEGAAYPEVLLYRGSALQDLGDCGRAAAVYQTLMDGWPGTPYADRARARLDRCGEAADRAASGDHSAGIRE